MMDRRDAAHREEAPLSETADGKSESAADTGEEMAVNPAADRDAEGVAAEIEETSEPAQSVEAEGIHQLRATEIDGSATGPPTAARSDGWANLYRMLDVPLALTVELGATEMPLSEVLKLEAGSVITIDRAPGEPIDLLINGRLFARGEVVVISDTFGCRITELVDDAAATIEIARNGG